MAERLARLYGTEMDKVNCPFFFKMGACRYGDSCERIHNKPPISETLVFPHLYQNAPFQTAMATGIMVNSEDAEAAMTRFQNFFEDVFTEMSNFGEIEQMVIVDNLGDHIVGNVYVKFTTEDYAENAFFNINGKFFDGRKIEAQYSPVTDFANAKCKQYLDGNCKRGGYCNYMHVKPLSRTFKKELFAKMYRDHPEYIKKKEEERERQRERERERRGEDDRSPRRERSRDRSKDSRDRKKKHKKEKDRDRSRSQKRSKKHRKHKSDESGNSGDDVKQKYEQGPEDQGRDKPPTSGTWKD